MSNKKKYLGNLYINQLASLYKSYSNEELLIQYKMGLSKSIIYILNQLGSLIELYETKQEVIGEQEVKVENKQLKN